MLPSVIHITRNSMAAAIHFFLTWNTQSRHEPRHDKTNKMAVRPAKTQISLGIYPVWSESSLCAQWVAKDPRFLHADSEDSDQTGRTPRLIRVFAGRTLTLLVLSYRGSHYSPGEYFDNRITISKRNYAVVFWAIEQLWDVSLNTL